MGSLVIPLRWTRRVGDIEPQSNEGNYNLGVDTDAAHSALHIALVRQIEVV